MRAICGIGSLQTDIDVLDSSWSSAAVDATKCAAFTSSTAEGSAFDSDLAGWKRFVQNPGAFNVDVVLASWQTKLSEWQQKIKTAGCQVSGTTVLPPAPSQAADVAKWIAIAIALLVGLYLFGPAIRKQLGR